MKLLNKNKYESSAYWTQLVQLMIFDNIKRYLDENHLTRTEFATRLGVSKGYVSQILNGDFDHKLSKLVELALACDMVPRIELMPKAYAEQVVENTYLQPKDWRQSGVYFRTIPFVKPEVKVPASAESVKVLPVVGKSSVRIGSCDWGVAENRKSTNKIA
ncbi:helix-turn-helix transcriptional regulator [Duncaniella sp.]|uniref:helix-turn-helix domain-containing protein n=1 Tax=Duncaniella sp. TaxID=2518496 RepID=UPI0023C1E5B5|nr:helix-turn-helix transcriptional regulator [Duncaniella sp.]MDE5904729.1 helix-turn-helix domain-containing protein [Duncaniella sp.]